MQRHSLYINHEKVSTLIRQLQQIVSICKQQLDNQYQSYQIRQSIYQEFIFQLTTQFYLQKAVKLDGQDAKNQDLIKFYELTAKLQGLKSDAKFQHSLKNQQIRLSKGRPLIKRQGEDQFISHLRNQIQKTGVNRFSKKQLDQKYKQFVKQVDKAPLVNSYLRLFKHYNLTQIIIVTRGDKQRKVQDLFEKKQTQGKSQKFQYQDRMEESVKSQYYAGQSLQSTFQMIGGGQSSQYGNSTSNYDQDIYQDLNHDQQIQGYKRKLRSTSKDLNTPIKLSKKLKTEKTRKQNAHKISTNLLDDSYQKVNNELLWNNLLNSSKDQIPHNFYDRKDEIYENSKSFD